MATIPVQGDTALLEARIAELERANGELARTAAEERRQREAAQARADRATGDIAALELRLEQAMRNAQSTIDIQAEGLRIAHRRYDTREAELEAQLEQANVRLARFVTLHTPTVGEHQLVTAITRRVNALETPGLEVHIFCGGRRIY